MKIRFIFLCALTTVFGAPLAAQIAMGATTFGENGGGSMFAPCTEILRFDNYSDATAGDTSGQNFVFILNNGDSLFLNVQRTGRGIMPVAAPSWSQSAFGQYGYTGTAGDVVLYQVNGGTNSTLIFDSIQLKNRQGTILNNYVIAVYDGESTTVAESFDFTAPPGYNWFYWDSIAPVGEVYSTPAQTGLGTNTVDWVGGPTYNGYNLAWAIAVNSPANFTVALNHNPSGASGIVIGVQRSIIALNDTFCTGGNIMINPVNAPPGTTYTWGNPVVTPLGSISGGAEQSTPVDSIQQMLVYNGDGLATITYTITPNSCGLVDSPFTATVVFSGGITPVNLGNDTAYCGNFSRILTTGAGNTVWSTADTASQITITEPGTYWATISTACGTTSDTIVITQNPVPLVNLGSDTALCQGQSLLLNAANADDSYLWSTNATTQTITVSSAATYSVTVTNNSGCASSDSIVVGSDTLPPIIISANNLYICPGDSAHICAPQGYSTYSWNTGATTSCVYVQTTGNYYVTVTNNGCSAQSNHLAITEFPSSSISMNVSNDTFTAIGGAAFQWYLNGTPLTNDTLPVLIAALPGNYMVQITDSNGCSGFSNPFQFTDISNIEDEAFEIYPNPLASGNWQLVVSASFIGAPFEIYDANGRLVYTGFIHQTHSEIYLFMAPGIYIASFTSTQGRIVRKLVRL